MKRAIILHGKPSKEGYYDLTKKSIAFSQWLGWLQKQLLARDILANNPAMPRPYEPDYDAWKAEIDRWQIDENTMIIGHSCGGGFWMRYLSENKNINVGKVVLVSPSMGLDWDDRSFFDFEIDPDLRSRTKGITIFTSDNDRPNCNKSSKIYAETTGAELIVLPNHGHFVYESMGTEEFPELLEKLIEE